MDTCDAHTVRAAAAHAAKDLPLGRARAHCRTCFHPLMRHRDCSCTHRCGVDAWAQQDVRPRDVVAWPTNLGWMMGPWLLYSALLNGAAVALFQVWHPSGSPTTPVPAGSRFLAQTPSGCALALGCCGGSGASGGDVCHCGVNLGSKG